MGELILFTTGGTIATVTAVNDHSRVPRLKGRDIADLLTEKDGRQKDLEVVELSLVPSTAVTPLLAWSWAHEVDRRLTDPAVDGAVITMGTNAMEETAYLFELCLRTFKPVVVTGAMRLPAEPLSDARQNLLEALAVARDPRLSNIGVVVVMNHEIHHALDVIKVDSHALNAFQSPIVGPIGRIVHCGAGAVPEIEIVRDIARVERMPTCGLDSNVGYVKAVLGSDGMLIGELTKSGARGIVIEAFGEGSLTTAMAPAVEAAIVAGVVVVIASRTLTGGTFPYYSEIGESQWLANQGAFFAGRLSGPKARIRLMFALGSAEKTKINGWFPRIY